MRVPVSCLVVLAGCTTASTAPVPVTPPSPGGFRDAGFSAGDAFVVQGETTFFLDSARAWAGGGLVTARAQGPNTFASNTAALDAEGAFVVPLERARDDDVAVVTNSIGAWNLSRIIHGRPGMVTLLRLPIAALDGATLLGDICVGDTEGLIVEPMGHGCAPGKVIDPVAEGAFLPDLAPDQHVGTHPVIALFTSDTFHTRVVFPRWAWPRLPQNELELEGLGMPEFAENWFPTGVTPRLVDENSATLSHSAYEAVRAGTYTGPVFIDVPSSFEGPTLLIVLARDVRATCVCGSIRGSAEGHTVLTRDRTHGGAWRSSVTSTSGVWCASAAASEPEHVDVDGNGIAGEVHVLDVRVEAQGRAASLGPVDVKSAEGMPCQQLPAADFDSIAHEDLTALLRVAGEVVLPDGTPAGAAEVSARDLDVTWREAGVCPNSCVTTSAPDGTFTLDVPRRGHVTVHARLTADDEGQVLFSGHAVVDENGHARVQLERTRWKPELQMIARDDMLTWSPTLPMRAVSVSNASGERIWVIRSTTGTIRPPVVIGTVPAGAAEEIRAEAPTGWSTASVEVFEVEPDGALTTGYGTTRHP